jgi:outer membrane protein OmpA-like peptidoglycan-associated protein
MKLKLLCVSLFLGLAGHSQQLFSVHFDLDKYELTSGARSELDDFIAAQKEKIPLLKIWLNGYCDPRGPDGYNDRLSRQRVSAVKNYLLSHGIPANTIVTETGHGEKIQLNDNTTEEEMSRNRRVQVSFTASGETIPGKDVSLKEKIADTATIAGTNIVLRNINFVGGRHLFLEESIPMLEELLGVMRDNPNLVIQVEGHICCQEGDVDGMDLETGELNLSVTRARAVREYLLKNNIPMNRVSSRGFGHSVPLHPYPEKTEQERMENRRVEIKIIRK